MRLSVALGMEALYELFFVCPTASSLQLLYQTKKASANSPTLGERQKN